MLPELSSTTASPRATKQSKGSFASTSFASIDDDALAIIVRNVDDLSAAACVNRGLHDLCSTEKERREQERLRAKRDAEAKQLQRFAALENDARVVGTVIRHMLLNAPPAGEYAITHKPCKPWRRHSKLTPPASGVCRLSVLATTHSPEPVEQYDPVDALALQESVLRNVVFEGEPLGEVGAALAKRQAQALRLDVPDQTTLHGHAFKICLRADILGNYLASSPQFAVLLGVA